mmetsp:Transcript_2895/g.4737  ORF Transcript_2895/g.4737 Transcript_2895/m.4737 type:complete len:216 (-) Transcript_2895:644-1291(-)
MLPAADIKFVAAALTVWARSMRLPFVGSTGSGHAVHVARMSATISSETPKVPYSCSRNSSVQGCTDTASALQSGGVGSSGIIRVTLVWFGCKFSSHSLTLSSSTVQGSSSHFHASHRQFTLTAASYSSSRVSCKTSIASFLSLKRPTASVQHLSKFLHAPSISAFHEQNASSKSSCKSWHLSVCVVCASVRFSQFSMASSNSFQRPQKCSFIILK